jgi:hypothetical protein
MRRFLRNNGLLLVTFFGFFLVSFLAQVVTGHHAYNADQRDHGEKAVPLSEYLTSGHFVEATFENWESEFLQMGSYVLLTVWLRQRGSAESKPLDEETEQDEDPMLHREDPDAPWAVRKGGPAVRWLYGHSLSLAFFVLFALSWLLHAAGGSREYSEEQLAHGGQAVSTWGFAHTSEFWFQSFQNWQSEFLAVAAIVGLSVFLREKGSPESKPVHAPHSQTGA